MKKISALVMLFISVTILIHCQERTEKKAQTGPEKTVTIDLVSINLFDSNRVAKRHLFMYDSNGAYDVNDLTTEVVKKAGQKVTIYWEIGDGIERIIEIKPKSDASIIFANHVQPVIPGRKYSLELPLNRPLTGEDIKEAYYIKYVTLNGDTLPPIDPFIRVKPPQ